MAALRPRPALARLLPLLPLLLLLGRADRAEALQNGAALTPPLGWVSDGARQHALMASCDA
jgi:hypothetical protein